MPKLTIRYVLLSAASGAFWGLVAWILWPRHSAPIAGPMMASPLIGVIVGLTFRWIHALNPAGRVAVSLISLYAAGALFGLAVGFFSLLGQFERGGIAVANVETVIQGVPAVWWGLTFTGYVVVLWPLAYFNHYLLRRLTWPD